MPRRDAPSPGFAAAPVGALRSVVRFLVGATRHGVSEIRKDKAGQIAAALTYHTLFSLLPTLALILVVLRTFVGPSEQVAFKDFVVDTAVEWLVADGATGEPSVILGEPADASEFDATISRIDDAVLGVLNRLQEINFQSIGVVGVFVFLYASTGLLATIEQSFNQIYGAPQSRPWHVRLPLYYTTLTLAPLVIIAGQLLQNRLTALLSGQAWTSWLGPPFALVFPMLTTWIVFYLVYILIPNTLVKLRAAAIGALLAALGSVGLLELFSTYVDIYAGKSLYGALAVLPLALMWLWLNWLIILFGLEVSYVLQTVRHQEDYGSGKRKLDAEDLADPRWLITILAVAEERFRDGGAASLDDIAHRLRAPEATIRALADHLVAAGFLHRVERDDEDSTTAYALARSPEAIAVNDVYDLWDRLILENADSGDIPGAPLLRDVARARREALGGMALGGRQRA